MQAQTLSLQLSSPLSQSTLTQIFASFSPARVGLKELCFYVQIGDSAQSAEFMRTVKNGAFPEVKPQIYEILATDSNESACFKDCAAIFTGLEEVAQYYLDQDSERMFKTSVQYTVPKEVAGKSEAIEGEEEMEVIDRAAYHEEDEAAFLFKPIYEPSSQFEVEFEDSHTPPRDETEAKQGENNSRQGRINDPTSNFEVLQTKREETANEPLQPASPTIERAGQAIEETASSRNGNSWNLFPMLVLLLWIGWMII